MDKEISNVWFKPRVLVVDDEKRIRDGCFKMLSDEGFEVELAETGEIGLNKINDHHFDIILLDLMMPGLSGLEVLPSILDDHPDTVIIVITGYATIEHTIEAMKKGAFDFIPKPFSPDDLRLAIAKALEFIRTLQGIATEKSRMRVLINHLGDGVLATDNKEKIALANPAFIKMMGNKTEDVAENVIGESVENLVEDPKIREMIAEALRSTGRDFPVLSTEFHADDSENVYTATCVPFRDRLDRNLGAITVLHDITAMKKIDQLKSDFVSMVAHEIKSPMNSVLMQLKVVLDELAGPVSDKQKEILERASERIKALANLSSDLLDIAKIESGLIAQEKEMLNIAEILSNQTKFYKESSDDKGVVLNLELNGTLPTIVANKQNIVEVFANLISNAIRYTPKGGTVNVNASTKNEYLVVKVSDTGIGINEEDLQRIFDRFYRAKNEKTRNIAGTGLGLSIVKSILEAHNGMIKVDSTPDRGSVFSAYLPLPV